MQLHAPLRRNGWRTHASRELGIEPTDRLLGALGKAMTNADVIRDQYEAVNERDWERAMSHYLEDVELVVPDGGIRSGIFRGRDEVGRWFGDWMSSFGDIYFEITRLEELPNGSIDITAVNVARGKASGAEVSATVAWRYDFRDGRISRVEGGDLKG